MSEYCDECDGGFTIRYVDRDEFGPDRVEVRDEDGITLDGRLLASANPDILGLGAMQSPDIAAAEDLGSVAALSVMLWESTKRHDKTLVNEAEQIIESSPEDDLFEDELEIRRLLYGGYLAVTEGGNND